MERHSGYFLENSPEESMAHDIVLFIGVKLLEKEGLYRMNQDEDPLNRHLVLYQFINEEAEPFTLHIQLTPGYGSLIHFELLQKSWRQKIKEYTFSGEQPLLSLPVEGDDMVFIHAIGQDGTVVAGGIWQVQWRNDAAYGG